MILARSAPAHHYDWIARRCAFAPTLDMKAIEAVDDETGRIVGMVAYLNWLPNSVQAHLALESPIAARALLRPAFTYPFLDAGRNYLLGVVNGKNAKSLRLLRHLGFRETHRIPHGVAAGADLVFHEMHRAECRFLTSGERKAA